MNLLNPAGLVLAAAAIPIVALYILKVRLRRVPVSTLMFWRQIFEEKKPRSIWQRLRHWISLLLQLAFLTLLVLALAEPVFRWQQAQARRLVVVLDQSTSMNANDVLPSRLSAAKREANQLVEGLRMGDEMSVIAAGVRPQVLAGFTDHQRTLHEAIDGIRSLDAPTHLTEAIELAQRLVAGSNKSHKIVVLSDLALDGAATLAKTADVVLIPIGSRAKNVGITRLQARRSLIDPVGYEILVEVQNASEDEAACRLELDLDDDPIDVIPLKLKPGEHFLRIIEKTSAQGGRLQALIDSSDALSADNRAWAILPRRESQRLTLVSEGNLFLEKVFEAIPLVELNLTKDPRTASAGSGTITVFHRKVPATLPAGPVLVIEPLESNTLWQADELLQNPVAAKLDKDSQLLAHVRLDRAMMPEARKLAFKVDAQVLAETATGDPLYAVIDRPEGKVIVLTVNLDKSDLPLQTAFPIMMTNLIGWLAGGRGELRPAQSAGDVTEVELRELYDQRALALRAPDGTERPLVPVGTKAVIGPLDHCGVWSVVSREHTRRAEKEPSATREAGTVLAEVACNLADRRESDLRPAIELTQATRELAGGLGGRPIWFYLLVAAGLLTCWEWFLYQRRWID